ncbi:hypothetical protein VDP11_22100, partial [Xanthomonas campestris pv. campestris]|nr:hypothetical protein [Xanthomonas campestris pv. campestris]
MRAALEETVFALAVADDWMGEASSIGHTSNPNLAGAPLGAIGVTGKAHRAQARSYKSGRCLCRCMRRWEKQFALAVADDWMGEASSIGHTSNPNLAGAPLGAMSVTGKAHR